jgi:hypothetical protein
VTNFGDENLGEIWWTRSQRIRTEGEITFEIAILNSTPAPLYQKIAKEVSDLHQLGLNNVCIAKYLGVDDKIVAKALRWKVDYDLPPVFIPTAVRVQPPDVRF